MERVDGMGGRRITVITVAAILLLGGCLLWWPFANAQASGRRRAVTPGDRFVGPPQAVRLGTIPSDAEIVYHQDGLIYVMNRQHATITQITFDNPRRWEHVAVSRDRRFVVANEQLPNPTGEAGGFSRLWIFDLTAGTEARLLPEFVTAGNGGVDWDAGGFIYFAAKQKNVVPQPQSRADFLANAGANDIYRVRYDGSSLQRLRETPLDGEADVSVSEDGSLVAFHSQPLDDEAHTEIRLMNADGSNPRLVYRGGANRAGSVHDPELSPDNSGMVFSRVNSEVPPNFPENPDANTAHDIWRVRIDGTDATRLTRAGPISITPDWKGDEVLFLHISETERYAGLAVIRADAVDQSPTRLGSGPNIAKWIP